MLRDIKQSGKIMLVSSGVMQIEKMNGNDIGCLLGINNKAVRHLRFVFEGLPGLMHFCVIVPKRKISDSENILPYQSGNNMIYFRPFGEPPAK